MEPSRDEWFRTRFSYGNLLVSAGDGRTGSGVTSVYTPDVPASPLACANQYQFCKADRDHCGPLASAIDAVLGAAPVFGTTADMIANINLTEPVAGRFQRLTSTLQAFPMQFGTIYPALGSESLEARQTLSNGVQELIQDDQWQREMTAWWATALAGLQAVFVETAAGVTYPGLEDYESYKPIEEFEKDMCSNQASLSIPCLCTDSHTRNRPLL